MAMTAVDDTRGQAAAAATSMPPLTAGHRPDLPASRDAAASTSVRAQRHRQRAERTREKLLDVAEELFGRQGFRETSLRQVAERCEVSVGALYLHVRNKEELLGAVVDRRSLVLMARIRSFALAEGPGLDSLTALVRAEIGFYRTFPDFGRLVSRMFPAGFSTVPRLDTEVARGYAAALRLEAELIRRGQQDGSIRPGNPDTLAELLAAMVGVYRRADTGGADMATASTGQDGLTEEEFVQMVRRAFAHVHMPEGPSA
ncbi:TetR/AcrR family transcriptional regulator [Frankia sp. AiPa1]|uniref:TetR/AcrR family transcriptional regulator n=1 Tax=Frankia sp. AiPa1 TaxID=573492 RepID=UPI00202B5555|nr:TetR/AcrR family transcriptional regulator [Frankia sp. AiPa1]MCL9760462.1 TetR/AcrR family transcriptional regulator [Frankia sp. AiPa1]